MQHFLKLECECHQFVLCVHYINKQLWNSCDVYLCVWWHPLYMFCGLLLDVQYYNVIMFCLRHILPAHTPALFVINFVYCTASWFLWLQFPELSRLLCQDLCVIMVEINVMLMHFASRKKYMLEVMWADEWTRIYVIGFCTRLNLWADMCTGIARVACCCKGFQFNWTSDVVRLFFLRMWVICSLNAVVAVICLLSNGDLVEHWTNTKWYRPQNFCISAPAMWDRLLSHLWTGDIGCEQFARSVCACLFIGGTSVNICFSCADWWTYWLTDRLMDWPTDWRIDWYAGLGLCEIMC